MAWTAPRTANVGDVYTSAWYNADTRDNLLYLYQRPAAKLVLNTAQAISTGGGLEALTWAQAYTFNTGVTAFAARGGTSTSLVVPETGVYQVTGGVRFASNATGMRQVVVTVGGTSTLAAVDIGANPTDVTIVTVSDLLSLTASDGLGIKVAQTSGGNLNVETSGTFIAAVRVA